MRATNGKLKQVKKQINLKFRVFKAGLSFLYWHESESWIEKSKKFVKLKQRKRSFYEVLRV